MKQELKDLDKQPSIYMRFHITLERAISFIKRLYGEQLVTGTKVPRFTQALMIAGLTEDISQQDYLDYHLTWLTGVLSDTLDFNEEAFQKEIDQVLISLEDTESNRVKGYVRMLTYNKKLPRGKRYKEMLEKLENMDSIPCIILIFKLYQSCDALDRGLYSLPFDEAEGFRAYSYLIWYKIIFKRMNIGKNIKQYIRDYFRKLEGTLGGISEARKKAQKLYWTI